MLHSVVLQRKDSIDERETFHGKKSVLPDVKMEWKHFPCFIYSLFFWIIFLTSF